MWGEQKTKIIYYLLLGWFAMCKIENRGRTESSIQGYTDESWNSDSNNWKNRWRCLNTREPFTTDSVALVVRLCCETVNEHQTQYEWNSSPISVTMCEWETQHDLRKCRSDEMKCKFSARWWAKRHMYADRRPCAPNDESDYNWKICRRRVHFPSSSAVGGISAFD